MSREEVSQLLAFLAGAYPSLNVTRQMHESWSLALADDEAGPINEAALRHVRTGSAFPPVLSDLCKGAAESRLGLPDPDAVLAEILRAVDRSSVAPTDLSPLGMAVVDGIGWHRIIDSENPEALRAHIKSMAVTFRARGLEAGSLEAAGLLPASPCEPMTRRLGQPQPIARLLRDVLR